jgi:hypothetical protein
VGWCRGCWQPSAIQVAPTTALRPVQAQMWPGFFSTFPGVVGATVSKVCHMEIARTGLRERDATPAGFEYVTATVRSGTKAGYFPGTQQITVKMTAERGTGRLLGARSASPVVHEKRTGRIEPQAARDDLGASNGSRRAPNAVGARNGSQRVQPSSDPARRSQNLLPGEELPARLSPAVTDTPKFPDTEEVTGSNPVRPTIFENLSRRGSQNGSHRGARIRWNRPLGPPRRPSER